MNNTQKTISVIKELTEKIITVNEMLLILPQKQYLTMEFCGSIKLLSIFMFGYVGKDPDGSLKIIKSMEIDLPYKENKYNNTSDDAIKWLDDLKAELMEVI